MKKTMILAGLAGAAIAPLATAGSVSGPLTDAELNSQFGDEAWVAEGRFGNNRQNGDWELGAKIGNDLNNTNFVWQNEGQYRARINYGFGTLRLAILEEDGGQLFETGSIGNEGAVGDFNAIAIRLAAARTGASNLTDITINGQAYSEQLFVTQPPSNDRARSLIFSGLDLSGELEIEFDFTFEWADARGSQPAFQVKAGNVEEVIIPLPGAAGMALAGMAFAGIRRRR